MKEILYDWGGFNIWLFHAINDIHFEWLDKFMLLGTYLGEHTFFSLYLVLLTLYAGYSFANSKPSNDQQLILSKKLLTVIAVYSLAYWLDGLLLGYLKPYLDFPRPPLALPEGSVHILGKAEFHHSLPSGHATFAMMVVTSLWPIFNKWWRRAGIFFIAWVALSRISVGAHFPADVLAGIIFSFIVVWIASLFIARWFSVVLALRKKLNFIFNR